MSSRQDVVADAKLEGDADTVTTVTKRVALDGAPDSRLLMPHRDLEDDLCSLSDQTVKCFFR